jgi:hypothetical protein
VCSASVASDDDPNSHTIAGGAGTLHTYDAGSDPSPAMDSRGRGFFSCVTFDVASNASMVYVTQSPRGAGGSFFYNLGTGGPGDRNFVVVEDNSPLVFHDKEFIAADAFKSSPNRDNVYVTWTVFRFSPDCRGGTEDVPAFCGSPIYGSMSTDHGFTWSTPEEISGATPQLCSFGNFFDPSQPASQCNLDQGSDPTVLPDGVQAGFNGDYRGLTVNFDVQAHPDWSDTRNRDPFAPNNGVTVDEDEFTVSRNLPSGTASPSRVTSLGR